MEKLLNMKKEGAITLIALVITIIILLILAGITIATLTGENGLFARSKEAKESYIGAEMEEALIMALQDLQAEKLAEATLDDITQEWANDKLAEYNPVVGISTEPSGKTIRMEKSGITRTFLIDKNFNIIDVDGTVVTYTTEPKGYTNQNKVKISITVINPKGIQIIEKPNGEKIQGEGQTEIKFDYDVTANGTYTFKVVDNTNKKVEKNILIDQIDKLKPLNVDIKAKEISITCFNIEVNAIDAEKNENNSCSGIQKYEYFIRPISLSEYIKYESNNSVFEFTGLTLNTTYNVYVRAYDRAGNYLDSEVINVKTLTTPKAPVGEIAFNENGASVVALEYPILNYNGINNCEVIPKIGEKVKLKIISKEVKDLIYYYSINGGETWNEYKSEVEFEYVENTKVMLKSVCKGNTDFESDSRIIKKYKKDLSYECTAKDALQREAYDGDWNTYTTLESGQTLLVDDSTIGMEIKAKWFENDNTRTVNAFSKEKYEYSALLWYLPVKGNKIVQEATGTILEKTKSIIPYTNSGYENDMLYEITLVK